MGVGQVLSDTFGMVKARFGSLIGLWAIYFGITIVLFFAFAIAIGMAGIGSLATMASGNSLNASGSFAAAGAMAAVVALFYLAFLLVSMAQYASMILLASPLRQLTVGEALGTSLRAAPALLLLIVVLVIGYIVLTIPLAIFVSAFPAEESGAGAILLLLLLPVLVWLGCRLSTLFAVVAVDGVRNPFTAIARTWHLTRGHALIIFLATMVFLVILGVIAAISLLPSIGMLRSMADPAGVAEAGATASAVGGFLLFGLGMLALSVLYVVCYSAFVAAIHGSLTGAAGEGAAETFA
jgi:hypothetical protein